MHSPFRYFNSLPEVIRSAVMLYVHYPLSLRQVEDLLSERGIDICHVTVRHWWNRFGPLFAAEIRKRRVPRIGIRTGAGTLMRCSFGSTGRIFGGDPKRHKIAAHLVVCSDFQTELAARP